MDCEANSVATIEAVAERRQLPETTLVQRVRAGQLDSVTPFDCISEASIFVKAVFVKTARTVLSGGRLPPRKRTTSDLTPLKCLNIGKKPPADGMKRRQPTNENFGHHVVSCPQPFHRSLAHSQSLGCTGFLDLLDRLV
jgi:hypothetical protein